MSNRFKNLNPIEHAAKMLTTSEAAIVLNRSTGTLLQWSSKNNGLAKPQKDGARLKWNEDEIKKIPKAHQNSQAIEYAIIAALQKLGRATARQIETDSDVAQACRLAKIKCRHRLEMLVQSGRVKSDMARQGAVFWA